MGEWALGNLLPVLTQQCYIYYLCYCVATATTVMYLCYCDVTDITVLPVLQWCSRGVNLALDWCHMWRCTDITVVLQKCVTLVSIWCEIDVAVMQNLYKVVL
jgi:hypothetical protein